MQRVDIVGKKVAVIGLGARTGVSLVRYLCSKGAKVIACDQKTEDELRDEIGELKDFSYELEVQARSPKAVESADLILLSPGVPIQSSYLQKAKDHGKPIWGEVEFAARHIADPLIAISGTNGKSTTTSLLGAMLISWGKKVFVGGNLGRPLIQAVGIKHDFVVAEISSFQLESVEHFHPKIALLLNMSPNHLDRHGDMKTYVACKKRLFQRMNEKDTAILNLDDAVCREIAPDIPARKIFFSASGKPNADVRIKNAAMHLQNGASMPMNQFRLRGTHNIENLMAAAAAAVECGCPKDAIEDTMKKFSGLPHRMEVVGSVKNVEYINDSKSTTPEATIQAIKSFQRPIILIAGGRSKVDQYKELSEVAKGKVRKVYLFGECAQEMKTFFTNVPTDLSETIDEVFSESAIVCTRRGCRSFLAG